MLHKLEYILIRFSFYAHLLPVLSLAVNGFTITEGLIRSCLSNCCLLVWDSIQSYVVFYLPYICFLYNSLKLCRREQRTELSKLTYSNHFFPDHLTFLPVNIGS